MDHLARALGGCTDTSKNLTSNVNMYVWGNVNVPTSANVILCQICLRLASYLAQNKASISFPGVPYFTGCHTLLYGTQALGWTINKPGSYSYVSHNLALGQELGASTVGDMQSRRRTPGKHLVLWEFNIYVPCDFSWLKDLQ